MKATVIEVFIDAFTGHVYMVGDVIDISDYARLALMEEKKLVKVEESKEEVKPKKTATKKKKDV